MENNYRVATPEEKRNIMKKLEVPYTNEKVKEIYRLLPTADDLKKAETPEEKREILKKMILPLQVRVKERHRFTGTLESTDAAARLRDISAAIKAGGRHTGI